jgi:hypothetical protein
MTREEWYEMEHRFRLEQFIEQQGILRNREVCQRRMQFRRAVKAMFVNRAVRTVIDSNVAMIERILRNS